MIRFDTRAWGRRGRDTKAARGRHRLLPTFSLLERRDLLATFTVTNTADSGTGSLRAAIAQVNTTSGDHTIVFSDLFRSAQTINLTSGQLNLTNSTGLTTIQGPGSNLLTLRGNGADRVIQFSVNSRASVSGLTITGGSSLVGGGAIVQGSTVSMQSVIITGNTAGDFGGGGVAVASFGNSSATLVDGSLTMTDCTISGNVVRSALSGGGGILNSSGQLTLTNCVVTANQAYGDGGAGIDMFDATTNITNSTISNNQVLSLFVPGFGNVLGFGGGVTNHGSTLNITRSTLSGNSASGGVGLNLEGGTTTLSNSTIVGNSSVSIGSGGGVYITNFGTLAIVSCTITGNSAFSGGGIFADLGNTAMTNTILSGNTNGDFAGNNGAFAQATFSVIGTGPMSGNNNVVATDPKLTPLGDYGGPTQTMLLLPGSPAIAVGNPAVANTDDQRGFVRIAPVCIGATNGQLLTVTSTADSGAGTLRAAILASNNSGQANVITFSSLFNTAQTIRLTTGQFLVNTPNLIIKGPGANLLNIDGNQASRVFQIATGVVAQFSDLTVRNGRTTDAGGGILVQGTLVMRDSAVVGNTSTTEAGGISNIGRLGLIDSTISGNTSGGDAGGVMNRGVVAFQNVTIAANTALRGGGFFNTPTGTATLSSVTVSGNFGSPGGLLNNNAFNTVVLSNSVVAGNLSASVNGVASDIGGFGVVGNYNAIGTIGFGTITGSNNRTGVTTPLLSGLGLFGGTTQTLGVLPGSPLIGAGDPTLAGTADQRGYVRGTSVDPGAFQSLGFTMRATALSTPQTTIRGTAFARSLGVTVTANNASPFTNPVNGGVINFAAPTTGASATLSSTTATISSGQASVTAVANNIGGTYTVTASANGVATSVNYALSNVEAPSLVVSTTQDVVNNIDGVTSLREALAYADTLATAATITFDATVFPTTPGSTPRTITLGGTRMFLRDNQNGVTINGPTVGVTIDGAGRSQVFEFQPFLTVTLNRLTITGANTVLDGGAIDSTGTNLTLNNCTLTGNTAFSGAALSNVGGVVVMNDCSIIGNTAYIGAGIFNLYNLNTREGSLTMNRCVVANNTARLFVTGEFGYGGGLVSGDQTTITLTDCTFTGNTTATNGGAIYTDRAAVTMTGNTIAGNSGVQSGGIFAAGGSYTINSTIVAGNTLTASTAPSDIFGQGGATFSGSYNLIGTGGSGGLVDQVSNNQVGVANARLGPLGNYGGPTQTLPVLPGSPAIGKGNPSRTGTSDARGFTRGTSVDVGAYQSQGFTLSPVAGSTPQLAPLGGAFANSLAVTVTANNTSQFTNPVDGGVITFAANSAGGATATLSAGSATISSGRASITATASGSVGGPYTVTASAPGTSSVNFSLTNLAQLQPTFSNLASPVITYGTASTTLSGVIASGGQFPSGNVSITLNGVTLPATIGANGAFTANFDTQTLTVTGSPYTVTYAYAGGGPFGSASQTSSLTVNKAPLSVVAQAKSMYTGGPVPALTVQISGFVNGEDLGVVSGTAGISTNATSTSAVGTYPITVGVGTLSAANYAFTTFTGSTLSVVARPFDTLSQGNVNAFQGKAIGPVTLATFGDAHAITDPTTYTAQVDWLGDGNWQAASVALSGTTLTVTGGTTFVNPGTYQPAVKLTDAGGSTVSTTATVNVAADVTSQILTVRSGLVLNRTTGLFTGSITLTNTGTTNLGPLTLMLAGLPAGVTLDGASGTAYDGTPYLSLGGLSAGQSITVRLAFRKTTPTLAVTYTPLIFAATA